MAGKAESPRLDRLALALKIARGRLGSSDFSATLATELGLPFALASHFAPGICHDAMKEDEGGHAD